MHGFSILYLLILRIYREISLTPLQAVDTSCQFSRDWAELAGVLDTGNNGNKYTV